MKNCFIKILLLTIGVFYLLAYFEVSDTEKKQNYENESHTYVVSEKAGVEFSAKEVKIKKINAECLFQVINFVLSDNIEIQTSRFLHHFPAKRSKLFLQYSSLLI